MNKIYTLSFLLISFVSQAQISINRADFGNIGDKLYYAYDTTIATNFQVGPTGANVKWDFTGKVGASYVDSANFVDPSLITGAPEQANLGIEEDGNTDYFQISNTGVKIIVPAEAFGGTNLLVTITKFPMTYNDQVKDSIKTIIRGTPEDFGLTGLPFDSIRATITVNTFSKVDGWGKLTTPQQTYDALRVKNESKVIVKVEGRIPLIGIWTAIPVNFDQIQVLYAWYGKDLKYSIAEALLDSNGAVESFKYQVASATPVGLKELNSSKAIGVYPNPAQQELTISGLDELKENNTISIYSILGNLVAEKAILIRNGSAQLEVSELQNGVYFAMIGNQQIRFSVQH